MLSGDGGPDILLHADVLRNFGQSSVADGAEIEVIVQETARGMQAVEVLTIVPPVNGDATGFDDTEGYTEDEIAAIPLEPSRVKWFDKGKGFGFANVFGQEEDIFVHVEVLRRSGLADLQPGEAIGLRVVDGRRGRDGDRGLRLGTRDPAGRLMIARAGWGWTLFCAVFLLTTAESGASECRDTHVDLRGDWGGARFSVEIADDAGERAQGLMHRESLPRSAGMLFVYPEPARAGFWMKNTLISLDMIFVGPRGVVRHVHSNAIPGDLTPIDGGEGIRAVLEINGGLAEAIGIVPGSQMRHPVFGAGAAWPCEQ